MNGQVEEDNTKAANDTGGKTKRAKPPDSKPGKKRDRTPRKEIKVYIDVVSRSVLLVVIDCVVPENIHYPPPPHR